MESDLIKQKHKIIKRLLSDEDYIPGLSSKEQLDFIDKIHKTKNKKRFI